MRIQQMRLTCECRHVFDEDLPIECAVDIVIVAMRGVRCPKCGSKNCFLGGAYDDAPGPDAPLEERLEWWLARGDCGSSSMTIVGVLGKRPIPFPETPIDTADFVRCYDLLNLIPEWRSMLPVVSNHFYWWGPYVEQWNEWEVMYQEMQSLEPCKHRSSISTKLYSSMQLARVASMRLRYPGKKIETTPDGFFQSMK